MKAVFGERDSQIFTLGLTPAGRLWAALERLFFLFVALAVGGVIFYLPDYLGRYREEEPVPGMLFALLIGGVFLISLVAALLRFFRNDLWVVDADEGALVYQAGRLFGRGVQQTGIDFEYIERFLVDVKNAPRDSRLLVQLSDGGGERMLVTRFGADSLSRAADDLGAFLRSRGIDIPIESAEG
jgi:hypothetical protein